MPEGNNDFFLFRDFSEPAFIIDTQGTILEANAVFIAGFFKDRGDVHGSNVFELISSVFHEPEISASRKALVDKVVSTGKHIFFDDESLGRVFRNFIYPIKNAEGQTTRLLIVVHDMTVQVRIEKQAEKTYRIHKALLDAIPGSVFVMSDSYLIHSCNDFALELFGDHNGEIQKNDFLNLIYDEDRVRIKKKLNGLFDSGYVEVEEARMHVHGNRKRSDWFSISAQRVLIDNCDYIVLVCMDIDQRKHDETRLIGYKRWMIMATEAGNTGLWDWNIQTDEGLWSNKIWELFGLEKAPGRNPSIQLWESAIHPDDKEEVIGALREAVNTQADLNIEYRIVHPDGSIHWVLISGKPVLESDGDVTRYCGIAIDVTDQKQLEDEIGFTREHLYSALEKLHIGWFHMNLIDRTTIRTLEHARIFGFSTLDSKWSFDAFLQHVVDEDRERVEKIVIDSIAKHKDYYVECQIISANGEKRRIWESAFFQYDNLGKATHILGMVQDITEPAVLISER